MPSAFPQLMRIFYKFQESREQKCSSKHFKDAWKRERYSDVAMVPASRKQPSLSVSIFICCPHLHSCALSVCVCIHWALLPTNGTLLIFILLHRLHHLMNPLTHCLFSVFLFYASLTLSHLVFETSFMSHTQAPQKGGND